MTDQMQAKDISDAAFLEAMDAEAMGSGLSTADLWKMVDLLRAREGWGATPTKVVRAKARSMIKRGVIRGCACGCRGDFSRV